MKSPLRKRTAPAEGLVLTIAPAVTAWQPEVKAPLHSDGDAPYADGAA